MREEFGIRKSVASARASIGRNNLIYMAIVALYCLYAVGYIFRMSFVIDGERYFCLFDDAMISMRYAKNLAAGHGMIWNAFEAPVEGISNPLWTVVMAAVHLLRLPSTMTSLVVQSMGMFALAGNLVVVRKIMRQLEGEELLPTIAAMVLTAFYLPLNTWGLQGMEVSVLTLAVTASVYHALSALRSQSFSPAPYIILGVGILIRIDAAIPFIAIALFMIASDRERWRRHALVAGALLLVVLGGQTLLRYLYYGDIFPNTYYLKMTGIPIYLRFSRGIFVTLKFIVTMNPILFALPFVWYFVHRTREGGLLVVMFLAQIAYSIFVGGDAWDWWGGSNRYVSIAMPCFFILLARALTATWENMTGIAAKRWSGARRYGVAMFMLLLISSLIALNYINGYHSLKEALLLSEPLYTSENRNAVRLARVLDTITTPGAAVAVCGAGAMPYFLDRTMIDMLGKSDRYVAHGPMRIASGLKMLTDFFPGHRKWAYRWTIGELRPDVIVRLWDNPEEAEPYLRRHYAITSVGDLTFYVRRGSLHICWSRIDTNQCFPPQPDRSGTQGSL